MADVVVINKIDTADRDAIAEVRRNVQALAPNALIVDGASPITVDDPAAIRGQRVLVVEDGPTLTHGEMAYGAGMVAAQRFGAAEIIDPRPYALGSILETYHKYPSTGPVLPAMGYGDAQMKELEQTINATPCDLVMIATPIDLGKLLQIKHPAQRVRYDLQEIGRPTLTEILAEKFRD
jgi:predicted GTPase